MKQAHFRTMAAVVLPLVLLAGLGALVAVAPWSSGEDFFMPHAHCYLFNRGLILLHGWSDFLIGVSYVAISTTLTYLVVRSRQDLPFHWMMLAFALFIVACGTTHFIEVWTLTALHPRYWLAGGVKVLTAIASLGTAVLLPPLVPKMRGVLQSSRLAAARKDELEQAYAELSEVHGRAMAAAPGAGALPASAFPPRPLDRPRDLAEMAKEVTVHARELERAKQEAEAANRAKDQFLAVLSHELRTPLTPALAAASNLENAVGLDPKELNQALALIRRNIELEARLVDDLLDITRINKGKLEVHLSTIDLHDSIRHAAEMCNSTAHNKRSKMELRLEAAECFVNGDGARMAQVFWNLVLNAVKFTPADGRVIVSTRNPVPGRVCAEVSDTGIGIEPEMLGRIFEPFQQGEDSTARRFGGVGLGLSIAKGLVEAQGGSIVAHSDGRNQGSSFMVEMATVPAPVISAAREGTEAAFSSAPRSLRILLVEDHEDTRAALTRLLTRWGHVVESAATISSGVILGGTFGPDLLLSDVGLPDGTGMDLLARLRQDRIFPAIAMSGYGMESDLEETRRAGFDLHLVKPVAAQRLKEAIERLMAAPAGSSTAPAEGSQS